MPTAVVAGALVASVVGVLPPAAAAPVAAAGRPSPAASPAPSGTGACVPLAVTTDAVRTSGAKALSVASGRLAELSAASGVASSVLTRVLGTDRDAHLDRCGHLLFADPAAAGPTDATATTSGAATAAASVSSPMPGGLDASGDAFALASRPGSSRTIYLDFVGYTLPSGSAWVGQLGLVAGSRLAAYDRDGNPAAFSTAELDAIREIWLRVAEDYAPFDVNVTTADPGAAAIDRSGSADQVYGTRVVITSDAATMNSCACGGIAYVGSFGLTSSHETYQPAFVFSAGLGTGYPKFVAEAVSHEAGHTFGLVHDGTTSGSAYFAGQGVWGPIMGGPYYMPLTTWDHGEYSGANNSAQDDLAVIAANAATVTDDHGDSAATATDVAPVSSTTGLISSAADSDWFRVDVPGGLTWLSVDPQTIGTDLDARLTLLDSDGATVGDANPAVAVPTAYDAAPVAGTGAALAFRSLPAGTYYVRVTGSGQGDPKAGGYSAYGSLGRYRLDVSATSLQAATVDTTALPDAVAGRPYSTTLAVSGGTGAALTTTLVAGSLPTGLSFSDGTISGTPDAAGTFPITVSVSDGSTPAGTADLTLTVGADVVAVSPVSWHDAAYVGGGYSSAVAVSGSSGHTQWAVASGSLPPGLSLGASGTAVAVQGTPSAPGTWTFRLVATDTSWGGQAGIDLGITVYDDFGVAEGSLPAAVTGRPYRATLTIAGGSGRHHFTSGAVLPTGLTFDAATGTVSGTAPWTGGYTLAVTAVDDGTGQTLTAHPTLTVGPALSISSAALPEATAGSAYDAVLASAGGTGDPTWSVSAGVLPEGVVLDAGHLVGTPTAPGAWTFTVTADDGVSAPVARELTLVVGSSGLSLDASGWSTTGCTGVAYRSTLALVGAQGDVTWSLTDGTLPDGVAMTSTTGTELVLAGLPTTTSDAQIGLVATDSATGLSAAYHGPLRVFVGVVIRTTRLPGGLLGRSYGAVASLTGSATARFASASDLPSGLAFDAATGTVHGTPAVVGTFAVRLSAVDPVSGQRVEATVGLVVYRPLVVTTTSLAAARHGRWYVVRLGASGGNASYRWSRRSGTLPAGVTLSSSGRLSGTPRRAGTYRFVLAVTDTAGHVAARSYVWVVR